MNMMALLRPLALRISNLLGLGVLRSADDSQGIQLTRFDLLDDETREVERWQNYGFSSNPPEGAGEGLVVFLDGRRDNGVAIVVDDRRYRFKNLLTGEVAVYDMTGSRIVFKTDGSISITPSGGDVEITGNLNVSGTVTGATDVVGGGKSLASHVHPVAGANAGGPVVFVPAASTGAPL